MYHLCWELYHKIGATLDKNGASVTWDSKAKSDESTNTDRLHLRQILLGHTAKENEFNVVEVSTHTFHLRAANTF